MELYKIKNEIKLLSQLDNRYRFDLESSLDGLNIILYEIVNDCFIKQDEIVKIQRGRTQFEVTSSFKNIKNQTLKSFILNLTCKICERGIDNGHYKCIN